MNYHIRRIVVCIASAIALYCTPLSAQAPITEKNDSTAAAHCAAVEAALGTRSATTWSVLEIVSVVQCDQSGPPWVAKLWNDAPAIAISMPDLRTYSRSLVDGRLATQLTTTATDVSKPSLVRRSALDVLTGFAIADVAVAPVNTSASDADTLLFFMGGAPSPLPGSIGLPPTFTVQFRATVGALAASDPDAVVQRYAQRIVAAYDARALYASLRIVDKTKITLTYICGTRFRIRNANTVPLHLTYDVYGTSQPVAELQVDQRRPPAAYAEGFFDVGSKGTVRVFLERVLVQTKANGNTVCTK